MHLTAIYSRSNLILGSVLLFFILILSSNILLWLVSGLALLIAVHCIFDPRQIYPALLWYVGFNWLTIVCGILGADLIGVDLSQPHYDPYFEPYLQPAVLKSLLSLIAVAVGIAIAVRAGGSLNKL